MIIRSLLQDLAAFLQAGFKLFQQIAPRLPLLRLELGATSVLWLDAA